MARDDMPKKDVITKFENNFFSRKQEITVRHSPLAVAYLGLFVICCRRCREQNQKQKLL